MLIQVGDCVEVMAAMPAASVDAIVTDPPYGLEFMGKDWDRPWAVSATQGVGFEGREDNLTLPSHRDSRNANCRGCGGRARGAKRCQCDAPQWDRAPAQDMRDFQAWCEIWAREALRVLKPGGHLLAFGGTRTYHRLACGLEDAGFEIRDTIAWLYGSGFPKSQDVSKFIDKAAGVERTERMRPKAGHENFVGRDNRKSMREGMLAQDGGFSRPWMSDPEAVERAHWDYAPATPDAERWQGWGTALKPGHEPVVCARKPLAGTVAGNVQAHGTGALNINGCRIGSEGRWPANVVLDPDAAALLDEQVGGGASRFFYCAKASTAERNAGLGGEGTLFSSADGVPDRNQHPTVKPIALMRWLCRLVTPPGSLVLDPFAGSGTTGCAAALEGFGFVGIERDPEYVRIARARLAHWSLTGESAA